MHKTTALSLIFSFIFSFQFTNLLAQKDVILNNPDISWVAEFTSDYTFSLNTPIAEERVKVFKLIDNQESITRANSSNWPVRWIVEQAFDNQYECYEDPGLTKKLHPKELTSLISSIDTVITFSPESYEETIRIVRRDLHASLVRSLRINQIIFYNKKTDKFDAIVTSIAPLLVDDNKNLNPIFWIKMDEMINSDFDLQSSDISWAALAYTRKKPTINLNFLDVLKNTDKIDFKDFIYQQAKSLKHPVRPEYSEKTLIDEETFATIYSSIDTIVTFDPENYEESITIVKNELNPASINQYRLVQKWYYDRTSKQLMSKLMAICPIVNIKDDNGKFKFSKAIYYIRYD